MLFYVVLADIVNVAIHEMIDSTVNSEERVITSTFAA